jgi:hypothetical protein
MIQTTLHCCDEYKIGKLNNYQGLDKKIDWPAFLREAVDILRDAEKPFYIKNDLRAAAPSIALAEVEMTADAHCIEPWSGDGFVLTR